MPFLFGMLKNLPWYVDLPLLQQRQNIQSILIFIVDFIHSLFDHEDTEAADFPIFRRQGSVRIRFFGRIVLASVVRETEGQLIIRDLAAQGNTRSSTIVGDIGENFAAVRFPSAVSQVHCSVLFLLFLPWNLCVGVL